MFLSQVATSLGAFLGGFLGCSFGEVYKMELMGFTAGSFIYITFCVILEDLKKEITSLGQLLSAVAYISLGMSFMLF